MSCIVPVVSVVEYACVYVCVCVYACGCVGGGNNSNELYC